VSGEGLGERILRAHLRELPFHRAITRSIEARILADIAFPRPMLDIGSGDGHFASVAFPGGADIGLDPSLSDSSEAQRRGAYRLVVVGSSVALPFSGGTFASALSNCVLEHIPDLDTTLAEVARVLRPGGTFICTVIGESFNDLSIPAEAWSRLGLSRLRRAYVEWFNRKARHYHFDSPERWTARLQRAGFRIERWRYYASPEASSVTHQSHYWSLPHLVSRKLTGRWVPFPRWTDRPFWVRRFLKYVEEEEPPLGSCIAFVCRR
jgi:SAM-dependent methyltransferase